MTSRERERLFRALRRLRNSGSEHPTDWELSNESALPVESIRRERERIEKVNEALLK